MIPFNGGKFSLKLVFSIKLTDSPGVGDQGSEIGGDWRDLGSGRAGNCGEQGSVGSREIREQGDRGSRILGIRDLGD